MDTKLCLEGCPRPIRFTLTPVVHDFCPTDVFPPLLIRFETIVVSGENDPLLASLDCAHDVGPRMLQLTASMVCQSRPPLCSPSRTFQNQERGGDAGEEESCWITFGSTVHVLSEMVSVHRSGQNFLVVPKNCVRLCPVWAAPNSPKSSRLF